jgi:glycosyltransferase involved in cell wall biosynthesis
MAAPRVTVAIPTYNRAASLREALDSVLQQSLTDIEVVVLDNASTDDTGDVVASLGDLRIRHVRNEINIGSTANLSKAFHMGEAPFVTVLPDDDLMLPGNLARKVSILEEQPDVDVVHSANDFINVGPNQEISTNTYFGGGKTDEVKTGDDVVRSLLTAIPPYWINFPTAVIRRSIIEDDVRLDPDDGRADDLGLALRLVRRANRVAYVAEPLVAIRKHPDAVNVKLGINDYVSGTYKATLRWLEDRNHVKNRFLLQFGDDLAALGGVRAEVRRASRVESVWIARRKIHGARSIADRWRVVREAVGREPSLVPSRELAEILAELLPGPGGRWFRKATQRLTRPIRRRRRYSVAQSASKPIAGPSPTEGE